MKKVYNAPEILFESFTMSTNIAGDCETKTDSQARGTCGYEMRGYTLFLDSTTGCTTTAQTDGYVGDGYAEIGSNTVCYHVPFNMNNLFGS